MKKVLMLFIGVLLFIPAIVLADMSNPEVKEYKATPRSNNGVDIYDWEFKKIGKIEYGQEVSVHYEEKINDDIYALAEVSNSDIWGYVKLSELKRVGEETLEDEAIYVGKVFSNKPLDVYSGPSYSYNKTGKTIPTNADIVVSDFLNGGTWIYVEYNNINGYIDAAEGSVGVLYEKHTVIDMETNKQYTEYYELDPWSRGIMVDDNGTYKKLIDHYTYAEKFYYENSIEILKDWKLQKTGKSDSETITEVHKGDYVTILFDGSYQGSFNHYVDYNGQKGWIIYEWDDENGVILEFDYSSLKKTDDYIEYGEGKVLADKTKTETKYTKASQNKKTIDPLIIGIICGGAAVVLTGLVTIILVNKKKKNITE